MTSILPGDEHTAMQFVWPATSDERPKFPDETLSYDGMRKIQKTIQGEARADDAGVRTR
jgi:hypothetical protein